MTDVNNLTIVGRLTRDSELKYTSSGMAIGNFAIAVNRGVKDSSGNWSDVASFFDVTVFGKTAENLNGKLKKGVQVLIVGSIKQDRWEKDGKSNSKVGIIADTINVMNGVSSSTTKSGKVDGATYTVKDEESGFNEDIPF